VIERDVFAIVGELAKAGLVSTPPARGPVSP
jgi:hypothetical protein